MAQRTATETTAAGTRRHRFWLSGGAITTIIGVALLVVVIVQNTRRITINFLFWTFVWPTWAFAVVMAVIGALTWFGLGVIRRYRRRQERRSG